MFATAFVLLYAAHLLGDYVLQTDHMADTKAKPGRAGWRANLGHAGCHVAVSLLLLAVGQLVLDLRIGAAAGAAAVLWIGATHALIDRRWPIAWWMENTGSRGFLAAGGAAHVDQAAHLTLGLLPAALLLAA